MARDGRWTAWALGIAVLSGCAREGGFSFEAAANRFQQAAREELTPAEPAEDGLAAAQSEPPVVEKSPILSEAELNAPIDPEEVDRPQFVAALDAETGLLRWKRPRDSDHSYSTPLVITQSGLRQIVSVGGRGAASYEPATGRELWWLRHDGHSVVPRPVFGNGLVYLCTGYTTPVVLAVDPSGRGDITDTHLRWEGARGVPFVPSPLLDGERIYLLSDQGVLSAYHATSGDLEWQKRLRGSFAASPVLAEGRLYLTNDDGTTYVVTTGESPKVVATNTLDGTVQASLAVTGRSLIARTGTHLYRIEAPAGDAGEPLDNENDWPQFRGPDGQGRSGNVGLPVEWSEEKNIVWKTPIPGRGWSSPVVSGNRIWLTTAVEEDAAADDTRSVPATLLEALCVDRETGRIVAEVVVVRREKAGLIHPRNSHASSTPAIDGDRVIVHFGSHGTACLSHDGELAWRTRLVYHHHHGPAASPIVVDGLVIVSCDGYDAPYDPDAARARGEAEPTTAEPDVDELK